MDISKYFTIEVWKKPYGKRKTLDYNIISKSSGDTLGCIMFYNKWRQHVFISKDDTYWNDRCLDDVSKFLKGLKKQ